MEHSCRFRFLTSLTRLFSGKAHRTKGGFSDWLFTRTLKTTVASLFTIAALFQPQGPRAGITLTLSPSILLRQVLIRQMKLRKLSFLPWITLRVITMRV